MARWGHFYYGNAHYDEVETASPVRSKHTHMYDLHKPFNNPFDDASISIFHLTAFATDHLVRANNNNTGAFLTARIAATQTALTAVNTAFQSDLTNLGARKTSKKAKDDYRQMLRTGAGEIMVAVQKQYGKNSAKVMTFFPQGLSTFNRVPDDEVTNEWTSLLAALTTHQAELGAQVVTDATALKTGWLAVYAPSETTSGAKDSTKDAKNTARRALQLELCKNWLTIALQFPRQPEMLDIYMQQSLLSPHNPAPADPTPTPPAAPNP